MSDHRVNEYIFGDTNVSKLPQFEETPDTVGHTADLIDGQKAQPLDLIEQWNIPTKDAWADVIQKGVWNGAQAAGPMLLKLFPILGGTVSVVWSWHNWSIVAVLFLTAFLVSFVKNILTWKIFNVRPLKTLTDVLIGTGMAFIGAFGGYLLAAPVFDLVSFDWGNAFQYAAGAAVLAAGKQIVWPSFLKYKVEKNQDSEIALYNKKTLDENKAA